MLDSDKFRAEISADLGLDRIHIKGQTVSVNNCWHFYTAGESVDAMFYDNDDFRNGMNRVYSTALKYDILILAFVLMDTHVHFILYGGFPQCNAFMHEFVRRTSQYISQKYSLKNKLVNVEISHQAIDDDRYLLTAICYTLRNPVAAGLKYNALDYPWSSGPLYFRTPGTWASPIWMSGADEMLESDYRKRKWLRTRADFGKGIPIVCGIVFPGEYVSVKIVEHLFGSHRSFHYFMCITKESDIDNRGGSVTRLSIPIQEMREHRDALCRELFGDLGLRRLDTTRRMRLARTLKSRYNSSTKQIARLCGLEYEEIKDLL
ncbi:MAG: transposase [Candidatus Cryptobacteroides sp.]